MSQQTWKLNFVSEQLKPQQMLSTSDRGLCNFLALMKKRNVIWNVTLTFQNDLLYDYPVRGLFRDSFPDQAVPVLRVPCDDVHVLSVSSELQWLSALPHDPRNVNKSKFIKITKHVRLPSLSSPKTHYRIILVSTERIKAASTTRILVEIS